MERKLDSRGHCSTCRRGIEPGEKVWIEKHKDGSEEMICPACWWGEDAPKPDDERIGRMMDDIQHLTDRLAAAEEKIRRPTKDALLTRIMALEREVRILRDRHQTFLKLIKTVITNGARKQEPTGGGLLDQLAELRRKDNGK